LTDFLAKKQNVGWNSSRTYWELQGAFVLAFYFILFCFWLRVLDKADHTRLFSPR